jgi:two-component system, chemotaxis family, response regulator PixG
MNQVYSHTVASSQNPCPVDLLAELSSTEAVGCLRISQDSLTYYIYLDGGKLVYLTSSIAPYERLERHLRRLSHANKSITNAVRTQIRLDFFDSDRLDVNNTLSDYQAICWLVESEYLSQQEAEVLIYRLNREVFESFLLLNHDFHFYLDRDLKLSSILSKIELNSLIYEAKKQLRTWQTLAPQITSSYQRPYLFVKSDSTLQLQKLGGILKGFSFRQLSALLDRDEIFLAKQLYPLIVKKIAVVREPQPPFDRLPKISVNFPLALENTTEETTETQTLQNLSTISNGVTSAKHWKIVCIDDSQTMLNEISRFLEREDFSVMTINEPLKALMKIISFRPNLILLDVGMPNIDGYKLCSLIRKYSAFRETPIVMVTGNKGLIDRARAKLAGATDYMTKPFTQFDLLTMIFRYLS